MTAIERAINAVGGQATLAAALSVTPATISQIVGGHRRTPPDRCPEIERATKGRVTCEELRPDVQWHRVEDFAWPHPEGRPLIDVAAPQATKEQATAT